MVEDAASTIFGHHCHGDRKQQFYFIWVESAEAICSRNLPAKRLMLSRMQNSVPHQPYGHQMTYVVSRLPQRTTEVQSNQTREELTDGLTSPHQYRLADEPILLEELESTHTG